MQYYKLKHSPKAKKPPQPLTGETMAILFDPESGELLIRSEKKLPVTEGLIETNKNTFGAAKKAAEKLAKKKPANTLKQTGIDYLGNIQVWRIEPWSTRQAVLKPAALGRGMAALSIHLGGGRGGSIFTGREVVLPPGVRSAHLRVFARGVDDEPLSVGLVLTSPKERPWIELKRVKVQPGVWQTIDFDLGKVKPEKLARVSRLDVLIESEADEGFVLLGQLLFKG